MIEFVHGDWSSGPVVVAESFWARLRGIRAETTAGVVIATPSIHTFGMRGPLSVAALDARDVVLRVASIPRRRIWCVPGAAGYLELRSSSPLPPVGVPLERRSIVAV